MAADEQLVIVSGRDPLDQGDLFLALDAANGGLVWQFYDPCDGPMDYGKAPRATPVLLPDRVILLSAFGRLHCVDRHTGLPIWRVDFQADFQAALPTWGFCGSPLIVGQRVIVQPGAADASLVCLDLATGKVLWKTAGREPSYSSFVHAEINGQSQVIGYDDSTLGGWRLEDGHRLWELVPEFEGDFNVPTPIVLGDSLWLATENNGTRRYQFGADGMPDPQPRAVQSLLGPDTQTPILAANRVLGVWNGLHCLDQTSLEVAWTSIDDAFQSYASMFSCHDRVLLLCREGDLVLIDLSRPEYHELGRVRICDDPQDIQAHPALVGPRLYVRLHNRLLCLPLQ